MSEARNQRFEIDIDEIERQLRRSSEAPAAPRPTGAKPDPLAELARIVGQNDPFQGVLGRGRDAREPSDPFSPPRSVPQAANDPVYDAHDPSALHGSARRPEPQNQDELFDPVSDAYGSADEALDENDLHPLKPRRSRRRLAAVTAALLVGAGAVAGGLYWRQSGSGFGVASTPPVITADRTPLKVAPENPGGLDVPNQNRQIYDRGVPDGQSRVVDGREQPIDVREAARTLPAPGSAPTVSARTPVPSTDPVSGPVPAPADASPAPRSNAVANALGEPRRVRTSAVRPDGSVYTPTSTASLAELPQSLLPGTSFPPPVPVSTVPVSNRQGSGPAPVPASTAPVAESAPTGPTVRVLPPARPRLEARSGATEPSIRTASIPSPAAPKPAAEKPTATAPARANFTVQVAVRPTEEEARQAYATLQDKYGSDLDGRGAKVTQAEVNGKTVHRVRVGPMTKDDANALCSRLKTSGGSCFVAGN